MELLPSSLGVYWYDTQPSISCTTWWVKVSMDAILSWYSVSLIWLVSKQMHPSNRLHLMKQLSWLNVSLEFIIADEKEDQVCKNLFHVIPAFECLACCGFHHFLLHQVTKLLWCHMIGILQINWIIMQLQIQIDCTFWNSTKSMN